jgi:hypothetical protein
MSDEAGTAQSGEAVVSYAIPADAPAELSVSDAARMLSQARRAKQEPEPAAESAPDATAADKLAVEADAAAPDAHPGETEATTDQEEELPPIEPPKSWTKEARERWNSYPRDAQEEFARVAQEREREFLRGRQEAAEAKRALEAHMARAEEVRKQYEEKLPALTKTIELAMQNEFGDIQTIADVRRLQTEDPFRFQQWQLRQMELSAAQAEEKTASERKLAERQGKRAAYESEQNKLLVEKVADMGDPKKSSELRERAVRLLTEDRGFAMDQLQRWMADDTGHEILSSAAFQAMVADLIQYEDMKKAPLKAIPKPLPPVQRPGTARSVNTSVTAQIQNLETQLTQLSGKAALQAAAKLTALKRSAGARN